MDVNNVTGAVAEMFRFFTVEDVWREPGNGTASLIHLGYV